MYFGPPSALGVMRSVEPPAVTLTPRAQRAQRNTGSGLPVSHLGVLCVMNGASHAKSAKAAKKGRAPVASELASDVGVSGNDVEPERRSQAHDATPGFSWRKERQVVDSLVPRLGALGSLGVMRSLGHLTKRGRRTMMAPVSSGEAKLNQRGGGRPYRNSGRSVRFLSQAKSVRRLRKEVV
jgi:hypothetical protein